jgi:hypothetical protein
MANTVLVTLANGRADSGYIPNDEAFGANTFLGARIKVEARLRGDGHRERAAGLDCHDPKVKLAAESR